MATIIQETSIVSAATVDDADAVVNVRVPFKTSACSAVTVSRELDAEVLDFTDEAPNATPDLYAALLAGASMVIVAAVDATGDINTITLDPKPESISAISKNGTPLALTTDYTYNAGTGVITLVGNTANEDELLITYTLVAAADLTTISVTPNANGALSALEGTVTGEATVKNVVQTLDAANGIVAVQADTGETVALRKDDRVALTLTNDISFVLDTE